MLPHSGNLLQRSDRCLQHLGQGAEGIQQGVGDGIGILLRNTVEQKQLQDLNLRKTVQSIFQKALLHPFPVPAVYGHILTSL